MRSNKSGDFHVQGNHLLQGKNHREDGAEVARRPGRLGAEAGWRPVFTYKVPPREVADQRATSGLNKVAEQVAKRRRAAEGSGVRLRHGRPLGDSPSGSLDPENPRKSLPQNFPEVVNREVSFMQIEVAEAGFGGGGGMGRAEKSGARRQHGMPLGVSSLSRSRTPQGDSGQGPRLPRHGGALVDASLAGKGGTHPTPGH